jgi:formate hydrogenlyase subunit 3/multisubunit Na+/H+ antiporter MnhD subunit
MAQGLGFWFFFSVFFVFFYSLANVNKLASLRPPFFFVLFLVGGVLFFYWGLFEQVFFIFWSESLGGVLWVGSSYIWLAGLVTFGCFGVLGGTRTSAVFYRSAAALVCIFLAGIVLLQSASLLWFFVSFEALLLVSLYLLRITAKADRVEEAALEMLVWALGSSFGLLFGFG